MYKFDYTDTVGGALLILAGGAVSGIAISNYPLGTMSRMGPGMFPAGLGGLLAILGLILVIQSFRREGHRPDIRIWSPLFVLGGVAAFAILIAPFGMIPAILGIVIISSLAELRVKPASVALLCLALCLIAPGVFKFGLGLQVPLFRWPF